MYDINYLPGAKRDLREVKLFLGSFMRVEPSGFFTKLQKSISLLTDMPHMYPIYAEGPYFRHFAVSGFFVFYHVDESAQMADIHRILHGSQDIAKQLQ